MIALHNVHFQYPRSTFVLSIPEWHVGAGKQIALTGPSGCGKTTLLHMLAGILVPNAGDIVVAGRNVASMSDSGRRAFRVTSVGQVFQSFELLESLSLLENILVGYRIHPALRLDSEARSRATAIAESLGLGDLLHRSVTKLSQGEQQRAAICRAVVTRPKLILADEPTGNLDPDAKLATMQSLRDQARSVDAALVVVTHDQSILGDFDEVISLDEITATSEGAPPAESVS